MANEVPLFSSKFYFIRHGESVANAAHQFAGQIDVELTERGKQDATDAVKWIRDVNIGSIFSSPLQRVWKTAEPAAEAFGLDILSVPGIMERSYSEWEGKPIADYDRGDKPPGGESPAEFNSRIIAACEEIEGKQSILVVAHSGTFRALRGHLCGIDTTYDVLKNGRPVVFIPPQSGNQKWTCALAGAPDENMFIEKK